MEMEEKLYIREGHSLHGLADRLSAQEAIGDDYTHEVESARSASLHWGSTMIKCFKGNEGARQDCYIFVAFSDAQPDEAELCIMKIQGICKVSGKDVAGRDEVKKIAFGSMATCEIQWGRHRCNGYSDGPEGHQVGGAPAPVHMLPSVVKPEDGEDTEWYKYAVELKDIQASALSGRVDNVQVFLPYVPMSSHA